MRALVPGDCCRCCGPSIFASVAIVFAFSLDDFVIVNQLCATPPAQTVSMAIYSCGATLADSRR